MPRSSRTSSLVVGIDLGGTNMQIGVVDARHRIIGRDRRKTQAGDGPSAVLQRIAQGVQAACDDAGVPLSKIAAIGLAAPGAIDIPRGIVLEAPNLRWRNLPLRDLMQKKLALPVVVDNDVNAAIWGEYQLGAGCTSQSQNVLGVWLGTGVGGGLVIDGRLFHGEFFTAGEIGQTVLFPSGRKRRRTVEDFCSRTGLSRTIGELLRDHPRSMLHDSRQGRITASIDLAHAFRRRDELAVRVVNQAGDLLGVAIANWVTVLSLKTVIIGGGVMEALGSPLLKRIRMSFDRHVFPARCRGCRLVMTKLKDDAGLLGAALLAREK